MLGMTEDSPVRHLVRGIDGNSTLVRGWLCSTFEDDLLEEAYQQDRKRTIQNCGRSVASGLAIVFLFLSVVILIMSPWSVSTYYLAAVCGFESLAGLGLRLLFAFRKELASRIYDGVMCCVTFTTVAFATLTRDRVAKMIGLNDDLWSTTTFMEANSSLGLVVAAVISCNLLHLPPRTTFVLIVLGLAANLGFTLGLGSVEFEHMSAVQVETGGSLGSLTVDYSILAIKQLACCLVTWLGSRYNEDFWRHAFAGVHFAARKAELEQAQSRALWQRLDELAQTDNLIRKALRPDKSGKALEKRQSYLKLKEHCMVPYPAEVKLMRARSQSNDPSPTSNAPNAVLVKALKGSTTSWDRIVKIATSICLPGYSLRQYLDDCLVCFPELGLYLLNADTASAGGRLNSTEYQRTIGALFAVYWLLRLDLDGKVGFVYGVDEHWNVAEPADVPKALDKDSIQMRDNERKAHFLNWTNWNLFHKIVDCAGCHPSSDDSLEAIVALLCLTAFHDIMKIEALLPTVQEEHGLYAGFDVGVQIQDHDVALAYILEHYPDLLPSFAVLPRGQQRAVLFTQAKLRFNHGWFVQAEAPPGALLSDFKQALSSGASSKDIGLYFLHWITDLAGAEATPLAGAEKLTIGFPRDILMSFLTSVPFLSQLVTNSETELVEEYYKQRWSKLVIGEAIPMGADAIARMRLVIMAQSSQAVQAFERLPQQDRDILTTELSRTGCAGQSYTTYTAEGGPAILVYYGPALLQRAAGNVQHLASALRVLSETLRGTRALWPVEHGSQARTVTVQIGELKSRPIDDVLHMSGRLWVILRRNDLEATVELRRTADLNFLFDERADFRLLDFTSSKVSPSEDGRSGATSNAS